MSLMDSTPYFAEWPEIRSQIAPNAVQEQQIEQILAQLSLQEKLGQMLQPNLTDVTPQEVTEYKLGSLLNGGGSWPGNDKYAPVEAWVEAAEQYYQANEAAWQGRGFRIPFIWGSDAVHGHNNVFRATIFPHNIGLGAAQDVDLIRRIGVATSAEVAATGIDWTFAPTVATPRDYRWGRVYEGYSEDSGLVYHYAAAMVEGIQGDTEQLAGERRVVATAKHFIGDGGTEHGVDRGINRYSEEQLLNIHGLGYVSALNAGVQAVMASFNSWDHNNNYAPSNIDCQYNGKIHGSRYLLSDVLKDKMGFDGLVISDWNGHSEVSGSSMQDARHTVNAGVDVLMVTARSDWKACLTNLQRDVEAGLIDESRIDDAVRRILRVKLRAGLWDKPSPQQREYANQPQLLGSDAHQQLAREAVRKSLVMLKNNQSLLPLSPNQAVLLTGSGADSISKQCGGWSLSWQGDDIAVSDFPGAQTLDCALTGYLGEQLIRDEAQAPKGCVAVVVIGEQSYAEMYGDIKAGQTLDFSSLHPSNNQDAQTIARLSAAGHPVVTVMFSGRPLYCTDLINHSQAFVAAWLPGTQGGGIVDVLFRDHQEQVQHDFQGRLSFSWPAQKDAFALNHPATHIPGFTSPANEIDSREQAALFPLGFGLSYQSAQETPRLELDSREFAIDVAEYVLFGREAQISHPLSLALQSQPRAVMLPGCSPLDVAGSHIEPINYQHQYDARAVQAQEPFELTLEVLPGLMPLPWESGKALEFCIDVKLEQAPQAPVWVELELMGWGQYRFDISEQLQQADGQWHSIRVALDDSLRSLEVNNKVWRLRCEDAAHIAFSNISLVLAD